MAILRAGLRATTSASMLTVFYPFICTAAPSMCTRFHRMNKRPIFETSTSCLQVTLFPWFPGWIVLVVQCIALGVDETKGRLSRVKGSGSLFRASLRADFTCSRVTGSGRFAIESAVVLRYIRSLELPVLQNNISARVTIAAKEALWPVRESLLLGR